LSQTSPGLPGEGLNYSLRVNDVKIGKFNTKYYQVLTPKPSRVAFEATYQNSTTSTSPVQEVTNTGSENITITPPVQSNGLEHTC